MWFSYTLLQIVYDSPLAVTDWVTDAFPLSAPPTFSFSVLFLVDDNILVCPDKLENKWCKWALSTNTVYLAVTDLYIQAQTQGTSKFYIAQEQWDWICNKLNGRLVEHLWNSIPGLRSNSAHCLYSLLPYALLLQLIPLPTTTKSFSRQLC